MTFWHSTKTNKPSTSGTFMVYQQSTGYTFIADVELFNDGDFKFNDPYSNEYLDDITYFAEIPPVPITLVPTTNALTEWETSVAQDLQFNFPLASANDWRVIARVLEGEMRKLGMMRDQEKKV